MNKRNKLTRTDSKHKPLGKRFAIVIGVNLFALILCLFIYVYFT